MAILRVRTKAGVWRFNDVDLSQKMETFVQRVEKEKEITVKKVSLKQNLSDEVNRSKTLKQLGLKHGSIIFVELGEGVIVIGDTRREIDANGNVKSEKDKKGFRPGMQALKDQKQNWTLTEMAELDAKYSFKVTGDKTELCSRANLDTTACESFNSYIMRQLQLKQCRCGILYGKYIDSETEIERKELERKRKERDEKFKKSYGSTKQNMKLGDLEYLKKFENAAKFEMVVEAIYEPKQTNSPDKFVLLDDPMEARADAIAKSLGLAKVGFIVTRPDVSKFKGAELAATEVIAAAETSLIASGGERTSPFCVVSVVPNAQNQLSYEAYTLTATCLDMAAEGALSSLDDDPTHCQVVSPFVAIVEAKEAHVVDNDFFVKAVPITHHASVLGEANAAEFPRMNRDLTAPPDPASFANYVRGKIGSNRKLNDNDLARILTNFHALMYVSNTIGVGEGLEDICDWVKKRAFDKNSSEPFPEGYKIIIKQLAGL